jgi:hypothetical protein
VRRKNAKPARPDRTVETGMNSVRIRVDFSMMDFSAVRARPAYPGQTEGNNTKTRRGCGFL